MKILFLISLLIFVGCATERKVERDAHGSIIREDPFTEDKLYKKRAEDARRTSGYGISELSKNCDKIPLIGDAKDYALVLKCNYEFLVRLKVQCEITQVVGQPFYKPVRYKELQVNIANIDKSVLKDPKRFPTKVSTDHEGVLDFSFGATDILNDYQIELSNSKSKVKVSSDRLSDPILMPEEFCGKNLESK